MKNTHPETRFPGFYLVVSVGVLIRLWKLQLTYLREEDTISFITCFDD